MPDRIHDDKKDKKEDQKKPENNSANKKIRLKSFAPGNPSGEDQHQNYTPNYHYDYNIAVDNYTRYLQDTIGNQAVISMYKSGELQARSAELYINHLNSLLGPMSVSRMYHTGELQQIIQAKFDVDIGLPDDKYEKEADEIADKVIRNKKDNAEINKNEKETVSLKKENSNKTSSLSKPLTNQINKTSSSSGAPLPSQQKNYFESRMNHDFSNVRIHKNSEAARSARVINARAYTYGDDIVFAEGEYQPGTTEGNRLIAHELVHTVQQEKQVMRSENTDSSINNKNIRTYINQKEPSIREPGADLSIKMEPSLKEVFVGAKVKYTLQEESAKTKYYMEVPIIKSSPQSIEEELHSLKWSYYEKNGTVLKKGDAIISRSGKNGPADIRRWKINWDEPGEYIIQCIVKDFDLNDTIITFTQIVIDRNEYLFKNLRSKAYSLSGESYVKLLESNLEILQEKEKKYLENFTYLKNFQTQDSDDDVVEIKSQRQLQIEQLQKSIPEVKKKLLTSSDAIGIPAFYTAKDNSQPMVLNLFIIKNKEGNWELIDATIPLPGKIRTYKGNPQDIVFDPKHGPFTTEEASIESAFFNFVRNNPYADGYLAIRNPINGNEEIIHCHGHLTFKKIQKILTGAGFVIGITALAITPIPGARVAAGALLLISLGLGVTTASMNLYDRFQHENLIWDTETTLDVLQIAGSLAAGAGITMQIATQGAALAKLGSAAILIEGIDTTSDIASGILVSVQHFKQIQIIANDAKMNDDDKTKAISMILTQAIITGGLTALGAYQGIRSVKEYKILKSFMGDLPPSLSSKITTEDMAYLFDAYKYHKAGKFQESDNVLNKINKKNISDQEIEDFFDFLNKKKSIVEGTKEERRLVKKINNLSEEWNEILNKIRSSRKIDPPGTWNNAPKLNEDVIIYHGSRHDKVKILKEGLEYIIPTNASRDIKAAEDAIHNFYGNPPSDYGIIESKIPKEIWNELAEKGHICERIYPGFSGKLNSTELRFNNELAIEVFNMGIIRKTKL